MTTARSHGIKNWHGRYNFRKKCKNTFFRLHRSGHDLSERWNLMSSFIVNTVRPGLWLDPHILTNQPDCKARIRDVIACRILVTVTVNRAGPEMTCMFHSTRTKSHLTKKSFSMNVTWYHWFHWNLCLNIVLYLSVGPPVILASLFISIFRSPITPLVHLHRSFHSLPH